MRDPLYVDPERIAARMGKCYIPDCDFEPEFICYSWWRYCYEHRPEEPPKIWKKFTEPVWFHSFR